MPLHTKLQELTASPTPIVTLETGVSEALIVFFDEKDRLTSDSPME